ncbi:family 78 glycoside hydrolase catalytic domain [Dactylosporangium sp. AC04546]|uniref:alpha-L-rhamnosidase n=1 Tax=Dactylosporangium sp. AC04546 TaxID=2862460 RepID=UPI001EDE1EDF|nr:alpha-L-rhamnosidase [Dactylosporangium sp. AC04546]WVK87197.1 family 78 glycoside hydrolase catalytic domain [Dactylosporangium sp. AC04546]
MTSLGEPGPDGGRVAVQAPTVEHHREPFGIGERHPRLSWRTDAGPGWRQAGYEIELVRPGAAAATTRVESADQVLVPWPGAPLRSRERVTIRVRVRGGDGAWSAWSPVTTAEAGLLDPADWHARPVGAGWPEGPDSDDRRPAVVRHAFEVDGAVASARLYITAHGLFEPELNGHRVGRDAMAPGWTVYGKRLRYHTYDVTALLRPGANAIGAWLGDGWYRGRLGWRGGFRNLFGSDLSLIAQLEIRYAGGRTQVVATGADWLAATGPIVRTGNYDGEIYDARDERPGWSTPEYDDSGWTPVQLAERDPATLVAPDGPPVRLTQEVRPVGVLRTPSGRQVLDFGQNLVGRPWIRVDGERGHTVTLRTAEVLEDGELCRRPLRGAQSTDVYILAGRDREEWEPRFTFHGFRYIEVEGWPGSLDDAVAAGDVTARVYHSDMARTGWFESSDPLLNRLHDNVVWSMRGNFIDVPTDCPQRDERVGWTGDIQVFGPTATFLYDCGGVLGSWLRDVAAEQLPDGTVPWYVPVIPAKHMWTPIRPGAGWGDAAVLVPWTLLQSHGDAGLLARQYPSAKAWVDLVDRLAGPGHVWDRGFQLGDWLDPLAPADDPAAATTDRHLVATAYFAWSARCLADSARVLGRTAEAGRYTELADQVRAAFRRRYRTASGRLTSDSQTAYALAIVFELLPPDEAVLAGGRLAELVAAGGNRIGTGFLGTPVVLDALERTGHLDTAYDLLMQRECPSWLYPVTQGATTIWERWDSQLPDGTVNPGQMTSFNHYAFGAVADWLHRTVAGIAPAAPGYRRILFRPRPGGGLTSASAAHDTPYGRASIRWELSPDGAFTVAVEVPSGTVATLDLAGCEPRELDAGTHRFEVSAAATALAS